MKKEIQENVNKARYSRAALAQNGETTGEEDRSGPLYKRRTQWERPDIQNAAVDVLNAPQRPHISAEVSKPTAQPSLIRQVIIGGLLIGAGVAYLIRRYK